MESVILSVALMAARWCGLLSGAARVTGFVVVARVGSVPCGCGDRDLTWLCECGSVRYGPELHLIVRCWTALPALGEVWRPSAAQPGSTRSPAVMGIDCDRWPQFRAKLPAMVAKYPSGVR
jgi:hypothetical protein